jgi:hypothetical protein
MAGSLKFVLGWSFIGAVVAVVGAGVLFGYRLHAAGEPLDSVPPLVLAFEVMQLHRMAAYGAGAGLALGLLERLVLLARLQLRRRRRRGAPAEETAGPDALIRAERARQAEAYLAGRESRTLDDIAVGEETHGDAPDVENIITARGGDMTYRILAYRHLTEEERMQVVWEALRNGNLSEPGPGGTATLLTSIGRDT